MKNDDLLNDDFLKGLIRQSPLDSPSDDFIDNVMAGLQELPEATVVKRPYFLYLKEAVPYAIFTLLLLFVFATSDLPFMNWLAGKNYFIHNMVPYWVTILTALKNTFTSKYISLGFLICLSAGLLFFIDRIFSHRTTL